MSTEMKNKYKPLEMETRTWRVKPRKPRNPRKYLLTDPSDTSPPTALMSRIGRSYPRVEKPRDYYEK